MGIEIWKSLKIPERKISKFRNPAIGIDIQIEIILYLLCIL